MQSGSDSKRREGPDMISNLPDSIIAHILSFLSTKEAVRTSLLCKRWIYLWTFLTKLTFNDSDHSCNNKSNKSDKSVSFSKFVNRVLFHLNTVLQEFHLSLSKNYDSYSINQWISAVLYRGVKKIKVRSRKECETLCFPLLKFQFLEEMVFEMVYCSTMKLPSFVCFPSLTILKLIGIKFTWYSSNESKSKELTLHFPLLREYVTRDCTWSDLKSITIEAPLLEFVDFMSYDKPNFEFQIIKFCATHIQKFYYECPISSQTILLDHQRIPSVKLVIYDYDNCSAEESWIFIHRHLSLFTNVEYLGLSFDSLFTGIAPVEHYLDGIPTFQMLTHLQLSFTSDVLLGFLLKSPCLKTLVFEMADYDVEWQNFAIVPDCFISTLKVVKFDKYFGGTGEISFAKYVMENAKALERISFSFPEWMYSSKVESAKEQLSLIKINSSNAIMDFQFN